jgi:cyclophilin family peptidyl-prolyl cis-trans isomerase
MRLRLLETGRWRRSRKNASATARRVHRQSLFVQSLEDRQLLSASLGTIANLSVPALQGYTQPLDGSATTDAQTFSASSSNPDIAVSIVSTTFWNVGISYTDPNSSGNSVSGTLTFALFGNLTPKTVEMITEFTDDGYYVNHGSFIWRVASNFGGTTTTVIEGGSKTAQGSSAASGQPNTPFANENDQPLAPTGIDQLFMSNTGGTDSNDAQFFIDTGPLNSQLGYGYTLFGQLVSGAGILARIAAVPVVPNSFGEVSMPKYPITITSTTLSTANSNGVVLIDTTQAHPGETATITVTANDNVKSATQTQRSFQVTVGPYAGSTDPSMLATLNFKPFAAPVVVTTGTHSPVPVQLAGQEAAPLDPAPVSSYTILSNPAHGTISDFNPATGTFFYTPTPGFLGTDTFTYSATSSGPNPGEPSATSNPSTVTITVNQGVAALVGVEVFTNGRAKVTRIELFWSGPLEASLARSKAPFRLETANRNGSFTGPGSGSIAINKPKYDGNGWTVTLTPATLFSKNKDVELLVHGFGRNGLKDSFGNDIFGDDGPGTNATWNLRAPQAISR